MKPRSPLSCYLCSVEDPNETHFDPAQHRLCVVHAVALWELAAKGLEFKIRGRTVAIKLEEPKTGRRRGRRLLPRRFAVSQLSKVPLGSAGPSAVLRLSTGYEVTIEFPDAHEGFQQLARALIGEIVVEKLKTGTKKAGWSPALRAAGDEIAGILNGIEPGVMRRLLHWAIWSYMCVEFDRYNEERISGN